MLDWIKLGNKNQPEFWQKYLASFDKKTNRIVVLTIDTSGSDHKVDTILRFGAIAISENAMMVGDSFEAHIVQIKKETNKIEADNDYLDLSIKEKVTESYAIEHLIEYLQNATIVGHRIDFDIEFIDEALSKIGCGKLKNIALDIETMYRKWKDVSDSKNFTINDLRSEFKIEKSDRNDTIEDALDLGLVFLKLKPRLGL